MLEPVDRTRMNVLVFGADGLVGARTVRALACSAEFRAVVAVRDGGPRAGGPNVEARIYNGRDAKSLRQALTGIDFVVHSDTRATASTTKALCQAARCAPLRRIVHVSSMAVYGDACDVQTEAMPLTGRVSRYGQGKRDCEQVIQEYARAGGNAVILRPGCPFGPGSAAWAGRLGRLLQAGRLGDLGSGGDGVCNTVFIDDLAAAIVAALGMPGRGCETFNISDPMPGTWNEFLVQFGCLIGATPVRRLAPRRILLETWIVAPILEAARRGGGVAGLPAGWILEAITPSLARLFRHEMWLSPLKADQVLRFPRTPPSTALTEAAGWFLATNARRPQHRAEPRPSKEIPHSACPSR